MRRKDREITDFDAMLQIVQDCDCCRLGLAENGTAYIVPLNFGWEAAEGRLTLYFHSAQEGKKLDLLHAHAAAGFEMDTGHRLVPGERADQYTFAYRSVIGRGTVTFLQDSAEKLAGLNCILAHYTGRRDWPVNEAMLRATAVYRLQVTDWTAKEHRAP